MVEQDKAIAYDTAHSPFSDPGAQAGMLDGLSSDVATMKDAVPPPVHVRLESA